MSGLVALTGATGFIGHALLTALTESGTRVRALCRSPKPDNDLVEWVSGDIHTTSALGKLVDGADSVIHCAGIVRGKSNAEFLSANEGGTTNLVNACRNQNDKKRFLLISSLAARQPELSWYAFSKNRAEHSLRTHPDDISWTIFRPTAVYGPGDREIRPLLKAMKTGILPVPNIDCHFSLLHINDLVTAILQWLDHKETHGRLYELDDGTANGYNWDSLIELANHIWGSSVIKIPVPVTLLKVLATTNLGMARFFRYSPMLTPGKVREITHPDWTCDNSAVTEELGWQARIKLADAMQDPSLLKL